ncbi:MAG: hypothetical protein JW904_05870 [Spirochaetales bacterium]|nr:hypothetical protein [Spirochaetales bacterium]
MLNKRNILIVATAIIAIIIVIITIEVGIQTGSKKEFGEKHGNTLVMKAYKQSDYITNFESFSDEGDQVVTYLNSIRFGNHENPKESPFAQYGLTEKFFAEFTGKFSVDDQKEVMFSVYSDDGFILYIDGESVSRFSGNRGYAETKISVPVSPGEHSLKLRYYQSGGHIGLDAYYLLPEGGDWFPIGTDAPFLKFKELVDD